MAAPSVQRAVRWILSAVIVVFLVLFARSVDWRAAWAAIRGAGVALLLAATLVNFLSIALKGVRWWIFLRPAGVRSLWLTVRAALAGAALNNILVAQGGEAARVLFVSRASHTPSSTVLATLALERMFDAVGFVVVLVIATSGFPLPPSLSRWRVPAAIALVGIVAALVFLARGKKEVAKVVAEAVAPASLWAKSKDYVRRFASGARTLASGPRFAAAFALSMITWFGQLLTYHWCALATGVQVPLAGSLAALIAVNVGFLIRATPGNVGVFQVVYAVTVAQFGIARDPAIAVSLLIQTIQIIPLTLVGVALAPEFVFKRRPASPA